MPTVAAAKKSRSSRLSSGLYAAFSIAAVAYLDRSRPVAFAHDASVATAGTVQFRGRESPPRSFYFARLASKKCKNGVVLGKAKKKLTLAQCTALCNKNPKCTAVESRFFRNGSSKNRCRLYRRCDGGAVGPPCPARKPCVFKRKLWMGAPPYTVKVCVADAVGSPCVPTEVADLRHMPHPTVASCEETEGQRGTMTYADLVLPAGKALFVEVTTAVAGQSSARGFFVRPTRRTRQWGKAEVQARSASFYLGGTGQFSVEFVGDEIWRNKKLATNFDALMLFVNPVLALPKKLQLISPTSKGSFVNLGPDKKYLFVAGVDYDWGKDYVFKVHDNTSVYFEQGAHVRARIVQTEKKVQNIVIRGYGTLDVHHNLRADRVGISDDATRQNVGIYGKNIQVTGVTLINTNPTCGLFGYCLNINANWSPLANREDPFDAFDLQLKDPPYKFQQAHCQQNNMDDSPNTDFTNCPTSHDDGQKVSYVKCMTWQLGHDGLNAGKWGSVTDSFVRTVDDALKPWDSHGIYRDITIWQLTLGWPINFGWWNWNQPDVDTVVENVHVIHNHNWVTSKGWPETKSGQCVVGGIYGSGAVKKNYRLKNIFVETAAGCAVGLQISSDAYSRHPTPEGCVGSMIDMKIENMYFDEEFYQTGGYDNYLSGENKPAAGCTGELSGKIENLRLSGDVAGRALAKADFVLNKKTVPGLTFGATDADPRQPSLGNYQKYPRKNAWDGQGGAEIDQDGKKVRSVLQCLARCHADWSCDCVVFQPSTLLCYKRGKCAPASFDADGGFDVYVRKWE
eukprot:CAMPEP_0194283966 /NCGR_PEP_ID=MMETSP0169-20130528/26543_1 /TAXON_ID=218684 /ORGANISM="Corethron pennatum, Strain L29A3" /LENGTH=793 /DNA_ID=CAMNT_0039029683 /DNA_START=19 /DNA_END=2400 /DNA_ORIENTATION=+